MAATTSSPGSRLGVDEGELASMDRFTAGDPLRGLATLSIIISHAANTVLHSRGVPVEAVRSVAPETFGWMAMPLLYTGGVGLALFFAL